MGRIFVGTADGLVELESGGRLLSVHHRGRAIAAVALGPHGMWAILDGSEVWHGTDEGGWSLAGRIDGLTGHCIADTHAGVLVGTSQAHLLRVAGEGLGPVGAFEKAPDRGDWYTPWGGPADTRSISDDGDALYVNVHVGGVLRSSDHGDSWQPTIDIHADVHQVWTSAGRVYAACARGLAVSQDHGDSWTLQAEGLHATYCRAGTIAGDTVLLSASTGPAGHQSAVYRAGLDGRGVERCREGLPEWFERNIDSCCLDALPDGRLAAFVTADRRMFASGDGGTGWGEVVSGLPEARCLLVTP